MPTVLAWVQSPNLRLLVHPPPEAEKVVEEAAPEVVESSPTTVVSADGSVSPTRKRLQRKTNPNSPVREKVQEWRRQMAMTRRCSRRKWRHPSGCRSRNEISRRRHLRLRF